MQDISKEKDSMNSSKDKSMDRDSTQEPTLQFPTEGNHPVGLFDTPTPPPLDVLKAPFANAPES